MSGRTFIARRGTTPLPNSTVHDRDLSYAALGLLAVLLARPDGAPSGYRDLMGRGLGKDATLRALRDLTAAGYRHQVRRHDERGRVVTDTLVSEKPVTAEEAAELLAEVTDNPANRAAESRARSDQPKRRVTAGGTVRRVTGARSTGARSAAAQVLRTSKVTSLRSVTPEDQTPEIVECEHGEPRGSSACPICRRAARL